MRPLFTALFLTLSALGSQALPVQLDSICRQIDAAINQWPRYVAQREGRIAELKSQYAAARRPAARYELSRRLADLYEAFVSDSCLYYLDQSVKAAQQMGDEKEIALCRCLYALQCSKVGLYAECFGVLDVVKPTLSPATDKQVMGVYYEAFTNVYDQLAYYSNVQTAKENFSRLSREFEQMMLGALPPDNESSLRRREQTALNEKHFAQSMALNNRRLAQVSPENAIYATVALYRSWEFRSVRDSVQGLRWLGESVMADLRAGTMDQGSMWELANELMAAGDATRALRYISFTIDCTNRFGSRQRYWQIAPVVGRIAQVYKHKTDISTRRLRWALGAISVLAMLLIVLLWYMKRRNKQLATARHKLAQAVAELDAANGKLKAQAEELSIVNAQLQETGRVKDTYLGHFMSLCSQYVDKTETFRKTIHKKLKNKNMDEVARLLQSTELQEKELEDLYLKFDKAFLSLFPSFVSDFNSLLQPDCRITPKADGSLTTDLRIFALIRLGMEDSSKIAEFLHYSVNTIYNYRARIKAGALCAREEFENKVKELGGNHQNKKLSMD